MTAEIVNLLDRASIPVEDRPALAEWLIGWAEAMKDGEYGEIRSLVIVTENTAGALGVISQSTTNLDGARLAGLLFLAAHRRADGRGQMADLCLG